MEKIFSSESLINLREKLDTICSSHKYSEIRFPFFLNSILVNKAYSTFDLKYKGIYSAVVLGTGDISLISKISGRKCAGIFETGFKCLMHIEKSEKDESVSIEFTDKLSTISEGNREKIKEAFSSRDQEMVIDAVTNKINPLRIDNGKSILDEIEDDIRILDGRNLIKQINVKIPFQEGESVYSKIREVSIVTENYIFNKFERKNRDSTSSYFLSLFNYHQIHAYTSNFVILNNSDEFTANAFLSLIYSYLNYYSLPVRESSLILKSIFFVSNIDFLRNMTAFMDFGFNKDEFLSMISLFEKAEMRFFTKHTIYTATYLLDQFVRKRDQLPEINGNIEKIFNDYERIGALLPKNIVNDANNMRKYFYEVRKNVMGPENERIDKLEELTDLCTYIINFSKEYTTIHNQVAIKKKKKELEKNEDKFLRKKRVVRMFMLKKDYAYSDNTFNDYLMRSLDEIDQLVKSMFDSLDFTELNIFIKKLEKYLPEIKAYNEKAEFYDSVIGFLSRELLNISIEYNENFIPGSKK